MFTLRILPLASLAFILFTSDFVQAQATRETPTYKRVKAYLDIVPAIDTHDHLQPFQTIPGFVETDHGRGMNLSGIWRSSYFGRTNTGFNPFMPWKPGGSFDEWWAKAKDDFK